MAGWAADGLDPYKVTPGLLGFLVVLGLGLATWLLLRSFHRQLKRIDFDEAPRQGETPPPGDQPADPDRSDPPT